MNVYGGLYGKCEAHGVERVPVPSSGDLVARSACPECVSVPCAAGCGAKVLPWAPWKLCVQCCEAAMVWAAKRALRGEAS